MTKISRIKIRKANLATKLFESRNALVPSTYLLDENLLKGLDLAKLPMPVNPEGPFDTEPKDDGVEDPTDELIEEPIDEPSDERLVNGFVARLDI